MRGLSLHVVFKKKKKFKPRACAHHFTRIFAFSVGKQHAALPTTKKKKKETSKFEVSCSAHAPGSPCANLQEVQRGGRPSLLQLTEHVN